MLKSGYIHPGIISALSLCGHGDKILITGGNHPLNAKSEDTAKVYLRLAEGVPTITNVLRTLLDCTSVEKAEVILSNGEEPEILGEFHTFLNDVELDGIDRFGFYDACEQPCVHPAISTGKKRTFTNILITVGVT